MIFRIENRIKGFKNIMKQFENKQKYYEKNSVPLYYN